MSQLKDLEQIIRNKLENTEIKKQDKENKKQLADHYLKTINEHISNSVDKSLEWTGSCILKSFRNQKIDEELIDYLKELDDLDPPDKINDQENQSGLSAKTCYQSLKSWQSSLNKQMWLSCE